MSHKTRTRIRVFLVDDHPAVREGLRSYLNGLGGVPVVGEAASGPEAVRKLRKASPDVVVLDVSLPGARAARALRRRRRLVPDAKLLAFSFHDDREHVVRMARCGAHGYVTKGEPVERLAEAIRRVHAGGLAFPPGMSDAVLALDRDAADARNELTDRERQVLALLADGLANKQVARELGISVRTAEMHREHLTRKLNIAPIASLTKYAIQHGLTPLSLAPPDAMIKSSEWRSRT